MLSITEQDIENNIKSQNPWWDEPHQIDPSRLAMNKREYFDLFFPYVLQRDPKRALVLMGPRRVGKTVILFQSIQKLINNGTDPKTICYVDMQTPLLHGFTLESLVTRFIEAAELDTSSEYYIFFDEIQYLKNWEVHLKNLVDRFSKAKFIVSGSAAAALKLKSEESGAGRFTDFMLPPVTFYEYMKLVDDTLLLHETEEDGDGKKVNFVKWNELNEINEQFINYLNIGGYPEAIFSPEVQKNPSRFIQSDIIDKVLMKDLPSLYGISDIGDLNKLFASIAYNTGGELCLDALASDTRMKKDTLKKYMEYLESAFLIKRINRIDQSCKSFKRANYFKVYLVNPCMYSVMFNPITSVNDNIGNLVETAVFAQWYHSQYPLYYARWQGGKGEVDFVRLMKNQKPGWVTEVKWSDNFVDNKTKLSSLNAFLAKHPDCIATVTSKTENYQHFELGKHTVNVSPASVYCYIVGSYIINAKREDNMSISIQVD